MAASLHRRLGRCWVCPNHGQRSLQTLRQGSLRPQHRRHHCSVTVKCQQQQQEQQEPPANQAAKFDLPLAVALAGTAFEAYLEPLGGAGFEDMSLNDCRTIFMDRRFLTELYQGVLFVELLSGTNLRAADFTGRSDPYAVLSVGGSVGKSNVVFQNLNPVWNQKMCLYVRDPAKDLLKVRVYDKDYVIKSDDELGMVMLPLATLQGKGQQELDLPLQGPGAGSGRIRLRAAYLAFSDFPDEVKEQLTATKAVVPGVGGTMDTKNLGDQVPQIMDRMVRRAERRRARAQLADKTGISALGALDAGLDAVTAVRGKVMQTATNFMKQATSSFSPEEKEPLSPWKVLANAVGEAASAFQPLAFVDNPGTDTQVWLFANRDRREAVIAFRGTEQVRWKDLATDLNLTPTDLNPERLNLNSGKPPLSVNVVSAVLGNSDMRVHSGFLHAYDSVRQPVVRLLDSLTCGSSGRDGSDGTSSGGGAWGWLGGERPWRVMVTGHSLGGALATLCAYELSARQGPARRTQTITMYSFGAPRAGNKVFADNYDRLVPDSWRITNSKDLVPSVPRLLGYAHVKHSVRVAPDGTLAVQADSGDIFGEGRAHTEVIQELVDKINVQGKSWESVYEEIAQHEMTLLNSLVDGSALEEHMETFYLETLQACVMASLGQSSAMAMGSTQGKGSADQKQ